MYEVLIKDVLFPRISIGSFNIVITGLSSRWHPHVEPSSRCNCGILGHTELATNLRLHLAYWIGVCGWVWQSSQQVWAKKNMRKKCPFLRKKTQLQQKKRALFGIISFLKRVFCLPLLHKISPFNVFKTINYLFLFFNISKTSYFTKEQTPLMIIISLF